MASSQEFYNPNGADILNNKELEEIINQFGSLITIITNKPISCVTFFLLVMKNEELKNVLLQLTSCSLYDIVEYMAWRYPVLNKSKKIK